MKLSPRYDGLPIISIDGRWDDQVEPVARQRRRFEAMLAGIDDQQWQAASRCAGWTVQDVVAHLVGVTAFWEASVGAGLAGTPTRLLAAFDPAATPPLMVEPMRTLTPNEVLEQFVSSNDGFLGAIEGLDERGWSMIAEAPAGHLPIRILVHHALWDCWVHERDIALPLGLEGAVEPDEVHACLRFAAALSPALAMGNSGEPNTTSPGQFAVAATDPDTHFVLEVGESVAVHTGPARDGTPCLRGGAVSLVEALSLRAPLPVATPPEWRSVLGGLATAFDAAPISS